MRLGTIISIGASVVLALGALLIARLWMGNHPAHTAQAQAAAPIPDAPVVVAAIPIPWGAKLDYHYLKVIRIPRADMPQGAYASVGQVLNQEGGPPVALQAMAAQEPVLATKLTGPGERQTLAALVDPSMRAYTISVTAATAGGGHILPGDRVDILYSRELPQPPAKGDNWAPKIVGTTVLIQSVRVLGVDLNANPTSTQPAVPSTATLEVSMQDAEKLALAVQSGGTLSMALRRPGSAAIEPATHFMLDDPRRYARPAAYAADRAMRHASHSGIPHVERSAQVTVVSGETSSSVSVPNETARF
ncbi:MAG TPA: Flp pilus assembly protein CpaB [Caulobacteraceae bacterium]|nr:Flp pilus assembly protein CpaB [Caulobacteraceae bacterium]